VTGGAGVWPLGSETGGVLTVTDGTAGVETLIGVGVGSVRVIGVTAGVVTVALGRIGSSAPALAGRTPQAMSPSTPTTANRRLTNLAPLSRWLPIRLLSADPC
jgi:hypothetical protein